MFGFGILSCIVFLPLVGAGFILALRGDDEATLENARWAALGTTVIVFLLSLYAYSKFDPSSAGFSTRRGKGLVRPRPRLQDGRRRNIASRSSS